MRWPGRVFENPRVRRGLLIAIAALVVFLNYFYYSFRELIAAELLFGAGLAALIVLVGAFYALGVLTEQGLDLADAGIHSVAESARRWYTLLSGAKKIVERKRADALRWLRADFRTEFLRSPRYNISRKARY